MYMQTHRRDFYCPKVLSKRVACKIVPGPLVYSIRSLEKLYQRFSLNQSVIAIVTKRIIQQEGTCKWLLIGWLGYWQTSKMVDSIASHGLWSMVPAKFSNEKQARDISLCMYSTITVIPTTLRHSPLLLVSSIHQVGDVLCTH